MNQKVKDVLVASYGRASDMTHAFSLLGDGNMGAGIRALWNKGVGTGIGIGAVGATTAWVSGSLIYRGITYKRRTFDMAKTIGDAYNAGLEAAKQPPQTVCVAVEENREQPTETDA